MKLNLHTFIGITAISLFYFVSAGAQGLYPDLQTVIPQKLQIQNSQNVNTCVSQTVSQTQVPVTSA